MLPRNRFLPPASFCLLLALAALCPGCGAPASAPGPSPAPISPSTTGSAAVPIPAPPPASPLPSITVAAPAAAPTSAPAAPPASSSAAPSHLISNDEFADLQYYIIEGTNTVALELYDGSGTLITDIEYQLQTGASGPVLHVRIWGNKIGPETKKTGWNDEGNAFYYIDVGSVDKTKLHVVYEDDKGVHDIPAAGLMDKPFQPERTAGASIQ